MTGNGTLTEQGLTIWRSLLKSKLLPNSIFRELEDKGLENPTLIPSREIKKIQMLVRNEQAETGEKTRSTTRQQG